jgi:hypothetical protein
MEFIVKRENGITSVIGFNSAISIYRAIGEKIEAFLKEIKTEIEFFVADSNKDSFPETKIEI